MELNCKLWDFIKSDWKRNIQGEIEMYTKKDASTMAEVCIDLNGNRKYLLSTPRELSDIDV